MRLWKNRNTYLHTQAPGVQLKTLLLSSCTTAVQLIFQAMPQRNLHLLLKNVRHQSRARRFSLRTAERGTKSGANGNREELRDPHIHPNLGEHSCRRRTRLHSALCLLSSPSVGPKPELHGSGERTTEGGRSLEL